MTPHKAVPNTSPATELESARKKIREDLSPLIRDVLQKALVLEIWLRLEQLNILASLVQENVDAAIEAISLDPPKLLPERTSRAAIFAEGFYMISFRVIDITRYLNKRLFNKKLTHEPKDINNIRNHFIVHPENKPNPILTPRSFMVSLQDRSIHIKNARSEGEAWDITDPGFAKNLASFHSFIDRWTDEAISHFNASS